MNITEMRRDKKMTARMFGMEFRGAKMKTEIISRLAMGIAPLALLAGLGTAAHAGQIIDFIGSSGDGYVFSDPAEGVLAPGLKAVTVDPDNDDRTSDNGFSPSSGPGVTELDYNCLMSNNPDIVCNAEPGLGKRIKTRLTGPDGLDLRFKTSNTGGTTEYFTFGKTTNITGARITGFSMILGTGTGADFVAADPASGATFDQLVPLSAKATDWLTDAGILGTYQGYDGAVIDGVTYETVDGATVGQDSFQRIFFPDGLFGDGGQEGEVGFFSDKSGGLVAIQSADGSVITGVELFNAFHTANFGTAFLSQNMVPDGYFWDDNDDPNDEAKLVAWNNPAGGGWTYGTLADASLAATLQDLADTLGVTVADLGYASGGAVPADIVALMQANHLFEVDIIEDLANLNLNFSVDITDSALGEFTLRIMPTFAPIVMAAGTNFQFAVAGSLDAANIPYLAADPAYLTMITQILALPTTAEQQNALEELGYSYLGAYSSTGFTIGRDQVAALGSPRGDINGIVEQGDGGSWLIRDNLAGFVSVGGNVSDFGRSTNGIGYELTSRSMWAGLEIDVSNSTSWGVMAGGFNTDATIDGGRGSLDSSGVGAALFGRTKLDNGLRAQAIFGYQYYDFDSTRNVIPASVTARGSTNGGLMFGAFEADWMHNRGAINFGPMGSFELYAMNTDAFSETGAGIWNMNVGAHSQTAIITSAGFKADFTHEIGSWTFNPFGEIALTKQVGNSATTQTAFAGLPTMNTPVDGMDSAWVDVGAGFTIKPNLDTLYQPEFGAEYHGAVFGEGYSSHSVRVFAKVAF